MLGESFRPWGELDWILSKLPDIKWDILGCLSTEDRFIGTLEILTKNRKINSATFYRIQDPISKDTNEIENKLAENIQLFLNLQRNESEIEVHQLLEPNNLIIESVKRFLAKTSGNVILDISSFPKRFFFPILKILINEQLKNLIVSYSTPDKYCDEELSGNPDTWSSLPLFMPVDYPDTPADLAIVGIGFMPFGLPKLLLEDYTATPVKFLFPFPPGPPNYQRTWEFVRKIEKVYNFKEVDNIIRVDSNNISEAFDYIMRETENGVKRPIFAPYGPKPISIAMCLFASRFNSPVYYTQPNHYSPNYSTGLKKTYSYCITLNSKNLY